MMGLKERTFAPKVSVSLEELVPQDHFYRHVQKVLDLSFVRNLVRERYAVIGRPSIDPVIFFKLQLVMFFEDIRSERLLMRQVADRLSVRWYLGYDFGEPLPDHSSLSKIRARYGLAVFRQFFEAIVEQCREAKLVWGKELYFDSTQVNANADLDSLTPRFAVEAREAIQEHLTALFAEEAKAENGGESATHGVPPRQGPETNEPVPSSSALSDGNAAPLPEELATDNVAKAENGGESATHGAPPRQGPETNEPVPSSSALSDGNAAPLPEELATDNVAKAENSDKSSNSHTFLFKSLPENTSSASPTTLPTTTPTALQEELAAHNAARHDWIEQQGRQQREVHGLYRRTADFRISTTDPDATPMQLKSGGIHLGYHTHYVVDGGKRRIILAVLVTPGEVMDNQPMLDLLWYVYFRWRVRPKQVTGDTKYGTIENIKAIEEAHIRAYVPLPNWEHMTPYYGSAQFTYDAAHDLYYCPQGQPLRPFRRELKAQKVEYRANPATCNACLVKAQCTGSNHGRQLHRSFYADYLERVKGYHQTFAYQKAMNKRKVWIEPLFAEAKDWHGMRRFRLRRLWRVNCEALVTASGENLKRLLQKRGWGRRPFPTEAVAMKPPPKWQADGKLKHDMSQSHRPSIAVASLASYCATIPFFATQRKPFSYIMNVFFHISFADKNSVLLIIYLFYNFDLLSLSKRALVLARSYFSL